MLHIPHISHFLSRSSRTIASQRSPMRPSLTDSPGAVAPAELDWPTLFARRSEQAGDKITAILSLAASTDVITFSGGFPAPETFPASLLHELLPRVLEESAATALQYSPTEG